MSKLAGVPLIIIGGSLILFAQLISAADEGAYAHTSTALIAYPMMVVGFGVMLYGVGCIGDNSRVVESTEAASSGQSATVTAELPSIENSLGMVFKVLPAGSFVIGSPKSDYTNRSSRAQRSVTIPSPFLIGVHQVTQSQYEVVMGENPSYLKGANNPVEMVTWDMAVEYCKKLSAIPAERAAGREYRLPTDAEWEYACRAGTTTTFSFGDDAKDLDKYAWFWDNVGYTGHAVGGKLPNKWGLYGMLGSVWEWCSDDNGSLDRVARGGSGSSKAADCQSTSRFHSRTTTHSANFGFRLALNHPVDLPPEADK